MVSTHLKNISQNGNFLQIGVKIKNLWNHHLVSGWILLKLLLPIVFVTVPVISYNYCHQPEQHLFWTGTLPIGRCLSSGFHHMTSLEFSLPASFLFVFCQRDSNLPRERCKPSVDIPRNTYQKQNFELRFLMLMFATFKGITLATLGVTPKK